MRQSIAAGDEAWESQIVASFYRLSKVEERLAEDPAGAMVDFEARNREFHAALIAACPSRWLHHLNSLLFQQSERYRRMSLELRNIPRDVHAEHKAIVDATLARDTEQRLQAHGGTYRPDPDHPAQGAGAGRAEKGALRHDPGARKKRKTA